MKKPLSKKPTPQETFHGIASHFTELADEAKKFVKEAKSRFDHADDATKKKVIAGLAGAATLFAAAIGAHKLKKQFRKKKK